MAGVLPHPQSPPHRAGHRQARRCSSRSPVPVVVVEVGQSFAALQLGQQTS